MEESNVKRLKPARLRRARVAAGSDLDHQLLFDNVITEAVARQAAEEKLRAVNEASIGQSPVPTSIFDNRKRWIKAQDVARELGISVRTVYDWHHRPHRRNTPPELFNKFNGHLFLSTEALNLWMTQQATRRRR